MAEFKDNWEQVGYDTYRIRVPQGWLVRHCVKNYAGDEISAALCFVPDLEHEWQIKND